MGVLGRHACSTSAPPCSPLQGRERERALEQKRGALTILDQLAERERSRAAAEEQRRREGEEMKSRIRALKEEEEKVRGGVGWGPGTMQAGRQAAACNSPCALQREEERKAAATALMEEVARGNAELTERKRQQRAAEAEEARQIAEYIRRRDAREQVGWRSGGWQGGGGTRAAAGLASAERLGSATCLPVLPPPTPPAPPSVGPAGAG